MNTIKMKTFAAVLVVLGGLGLLAAPQVGAINVVQDSCKNGSTAKICDTEKENIENSGFIPNLVNTLLYLIGAVAVLMLIYGGFTYVMANGDATRVKRAKDIILYAIVGLIVAIMAWGIVSFTVGLFS